MGKIIPSASKYHAAVMLIGLIGGGLIQWTSRMALQMTTVLADAYSRTAILNTLFSSYCLIAEHACLVVRFFVTCKYISFSIHKLETDAKGCRQMLCRTINALTKTSSNFYNTDVILHSTFSILDMIFNLLVFI